MKTSEKNICQSCGMPIHHLYDFGTHQDGTINTEYCHYCYQNGEFTDQGLTLEQKIEKNISMAQRMGMPRAKASRLARKTLPNLKRWKGLKPVE